MTNVLSLFSDIKHFVFDIDGVLTNGQLLLHPDGSLLRSMNIRDGYALQLAIKKGYSVSIISGAKGESLIQRFQGLGIEDVYLGIADKAPVLQQLSDNQSIQLQASLYMGDDMPDIAAMQLVKLPCCPADACSEVIQTAHYISPYNGGSGCVRDVIEKVLKLQGQWE